MSGGQQAVQLFSKQGMYEADGKTLKTKTKAVIAHAVTNDLVLAATTYVWWTRRQQANATLAGKLGVGSLATVEAAYAPQMWQVIAEVIAMGVLFFAASIGGALTYNYGVGMSIGKAGSGKKVQ
jgi:Tfp pilus assembly protein PilX